MQLSLVEQLAAALSRTFLHSMWQGMILTILAGLLLATTRRFSAGLRYNLLCSLLFLFLGTVLITFFLELESTQNQGSSHSPFSQLAPGLRNTITKIGGLIDQYSTWIVLAWSLIFIFKVTRLVFEFVQIRRLCSTGLSSVPLIWQNKVDQFSRSMKIRKPVAIRESVQAAVPMVIGYVKPIILLPIGIVTNLPQTELEGILLHELAHIKRRDYLVNFIQRIAEIFLFFNPGFLWVSALIRIERENCCDDIAIGKTNDKLRYLQALIHFKEFALRRQTLSMEFPGKKNQLLSRMQRMVQNRNKGLSIGELIFVIASFSLLLAIVPGYLKNYNKDHLPAKTQASYSSPVLYFTSPSEADKNQEINKSSAMAVGQGMGSSTAIVEKTAKQIKEKPVRLQLSEPVLKTPAVIRLSLSEPTEQQVLQRDIQEQKRQAELDRVQAEKDREQAIRDQLQSELEHQQSILDRREAEQRRNAELNIN